MGSKCFKAEQAQACLDGAFQMQKAGVYKRLQVEFLMREGDEEFKKYWSHNKFAVRRRKTTSSGVRICYRTTSTVSIFSSHSLRLNMSKREIRKFFENCKQRGLPFIVRQWNHTKDRYVRLSNERLPEA